MAKLITNLCPTCNNYFTYQHKTGREKVHCSEECRTKSKIGRVREKEIKRKREEGYGICKTPECGKTIMYPKYKLCQACYMRLLRKGTTDKKQIKGWCKDSAGYIVCYAKNHPLASNSRQMRQHRFVAYEKYGPGKHNCFWCGQELEWKDISVDHLNNNKSDNRPDNLVISCNTCNRVRGALNNLIQRMLPERIDKFIEVTRDYKQSLLNIIGKREGKDRWS